MATKIKPPSPYHTEFENLKFGTWCVKKGDFSIVNPASARLGMAAGLALLPGVLPINPGTIAGILASGINNKCFEAKLLFSGGGKLLYEFPHQAAACPGKNKAKVEIPFSTISGIKADDQLCTLTIALSQPPATFAGNQDVDGLQRTRSSYDSAQIDFSGGAVKSSRRHTLELPKNTYRHFKSKLGLDPRLASLLAQGLPAEDASAPGFTADVVMTSLGAKKGSKRPSTAGAADAVAEAPKRVKPGPKKSNPKMQDGLVMQVPANAGPWMRKCVEKWQLVAPYDPSVTEAEWEAYYKERSVMEWYTNAYTAGWTACAKDPRALEETKDKDTSKDQGKKDVDGDEYDKQKLKWTEDWDVPVQRLPKWGSEWSDHEAHEEVSDMLDDMRACVRKRIMGCKSVQGAEALAVAASRGLFVLTYDVNWEDCDDPRSVDVLTRLYSPAGTARAIEFKYSWHHRARMYFAEHFVSANYKIRQASECRPQTPFAASGRYDGSLYSMEEQDSGYEKRNFLGQQGIRALEEHLFGRRGWLSERKVYCMLVDAAAAGALHSSAGFVYRVTRRKHKLYEGEESEHNSADDQDSCNEKCKGKKSRYRNAYDDSDDDMGYPAAPQDCTVM